MGFSSRQAFQLNSFILLSVPLIVFFSFNFLLLFFPQILYGILKLKTPDMLAEEMFPNTSTTDKKTKSSAELKVFSAEYVQEIEEKLDQYISLKNYCDKDCSIGHVTSYSGIPAHHLSHYFNQILNEKFSDWRSRLRISLMREGSARDLKLDEIARQCGYNVRSTFIDAFRKETGTTPGDYLRKLSNEY
jgi:AraC-like DNA-binding protein